jgi:hypothetical protein
MSRNTNKLVAASPAANRGGPSRARRLNSSAPKGSAIAKSAQVGEHALAQEVCSITNPFCEASRGSKWPDDSSGQTLAVPVRQRYYLTTDANGRGGILFCPTYVLGVASGTMVNANAWTWTLSTGAFPLSAYAPNFPETEAFRVVSGGVKITAVTSQMTSSGIINVIELPPADAGADYSTIVPTSRNYPSYESLPMKSSDSLFAVFRPYGPDARTFQDYLATADSPLASASFNTNDWTSLWVGVEGATASSAVLVVDVYLNFEILPITTATIGYLTSPTAYPNPMLTRASTAISRFGAIRRGNDESNDRGWMLQAYDTLKSLGAFTVRNAGSIVALGRAAGAAYSGNVPGALMQLGPVAGSRMIMDVD